MAIATAPVDFEAYDRHLKPTPPTDPALEALKACAELRSASLDALRALSRQATLRPDGPRHHGRRAGDAVGRRHPRRSGTDSLRLPRRPMVARSRSRCFAPAI